MPAFLVWSITALFAAPFLWLLLFALFPEVAPDSEMVLHLWEWVVPDVLSTTVTLTFLVVLCSLILGVFCATIVHFCIFPGRRIFSWLLAMPLALPSYIAAYLHGGFWDASSTAYRASSFLGMELASDQPVLEVRSLGGAIWILTSVLYPYVYLATRAAYHGISPEICSMLRIY